MGAWEDFEDEQAYADRLDQVIVRSGLCKVCAEVHSYDPKPTGSHWRGPITWRLPTVETVESALLWVLLLPLLLISLTVRETR